MFHDDLLWKRISSLTVWLAACILYPTPSNRPPFETIVTLPATLLPYVAPISLPYHLTNKSPSILYYLFRYPVVPIWNLGRNYWPHAPVVCRFVSFSSLPKPEIGSYFPQFPAPPVMELPPREGPVKFWCRWLVK
ncbi:hypothetical protein P152DRAFT_183807 [Eremomyces bilateralis CBS 781.70]|uniref:Uncharacterized protein n=1 Tax=Eremomyces bilateralis CBS 781.70 TaxID=1392243 RepID=A0A6G1GBB6_9PEZI|nr:uncharacterized protein P152DRAFT_183807 [Eremomyces bilateralis CBS 781.70]KAF1815388.1 hypothetical protein P152DRAFT_183807 [Eremomyces bilateralis CBS 781.70]